MDYEHDWWVPACYGPESDYEPDDKVFTVGPISEVTGDEFCDDDCNTHWTTDGGYDGYGITLERAKMIAKMYNCDLAERQGVSIPKEIWDRCQQ